MPGPYKHPEDLPQWNVGGGVPDAPRADASIGPYNKAPCLPPWGKVAPQGRMRGKFPAATRYRAIKANPPLISPLRGQLPPKGKPLRADASVGPYKAPASP